MTPGASRGGSRTFTQRGTAHALQARARAAGAGESPQELGDVTNPIYNDFIKDLFYDYYFWKHVHVLYIVNYFRRGGRLIPLVWGSTEGQVI